MCGINGIVSFGNAFPDADRVAAMNARLAHRGPDGSGLSELGPAVLGHRRLAIIDLSSAGNQPMRTPCGRFHLVYNGELYNYASLRAQLRNYPFRTRTDTEVLLAAYQRWGVDCLQRCHGMFAFAVWDAHLRQLVLARDRMGVKPVYFHHGQQGLAFSSELRALLASGQVEPALDEEGVAEYLRYQTVFAPRTIVRDVRMLRPGEVLHYRSDGLSLAPYWRLTDHFDPAIAALPARVVHKRVRELLAAAVEARLVADVPFGAFLSGGIDSSAVVAVMAGELAQKPRTFSVVFDEKDYSEAAFARVVAERYRTDHSEIVLRPDAFLETLPEALSALDHPSGDGANTYVVAQATKAAGVTMALSGLGGDELFAGYDVFKRARWLRLFGLAAAVPVAVRRALGERLRRLRPGTASDKLAAAFGMSVPDLASVYPLARRSLFDDDVSQLLGGRGLPDDRFAGEIGALLSPGGPGSRFPFLSQVSFCEISGYMQNVLLRDTDQMTMAHALEVRVPLLDHRLAEYVFNVADAHKLGSGPKPLLVSSLGSLLPREIVARPKMGFSLPLDTWLRGSLRGYASERLGLLAGVPAFNARAVERLWAAFLSGSPRVSWSRVFSLLVLGAWIKDNLPQAQEPVGSGGRVNAGRAS